MSEGVPALIAAPSGGSPGLVGFARERWSDAESKLLELGGVLFRGFDVGGTAGLRDFVEVTSGAPMDYVDRATPRTQVADHVFTATDYPPPVEIFLHNEHAFAARFPGRVFFHCAAPAEQGGQTPVADVRRVLERISASTRDAFTRLGVRYVRSFGRGLGLPWQEVFQTEDRNEMESFCDEAGIEYEWQGGDRVRTWQNRPAIGVHPETGEHVWMNHVATLHVSTLKPAKRRMLVKMFGVDHLPNDVRFGDGSPIDDEVVARIREAYDAETREFAWAAGDVLVLDNMLTAHGRRPYRGPREVLVAMARPIRWNEVQVSD